MVVLLVMTLAAIYVAPGIITNRELLGGEIGLEYNLLLSNLFLLVDPNNIINSVVRICN